MSTASVMSFPPHQPQAGTLTYEASFGLKEKPFSLDSDPRFLYRSPCHAATFEGLLGGIRRREGLLVLTGEIGTGKTTLCRAVLRSLGRKTFSSFVPDPFASREDLLKMLLVDFGVISIQDLTTGPVKQASRAELSYLLSEFLTSLDSLDAFAVAVIDEAQNMSLPMIEETRILADSFGSKGWLQVVFVGQPELLAKLKLPEMRQVDQRVCGYTRLAPLDREAVGGYVQHRLHVAGGPEDQQLFSDEVLDTIHRRSGGVPRLINRICDRALHLAHQRQSPCIEPEVLDAALADVGATTLTPTWASIVTPEALSPEASAEAPPAAPAAGLAAATAPAAPPRPAAPVVLTAPVVRQEPFSSPVDAWLTQDLAPPARVLTPLQLFESEVPDVPAPHPSRGKSSASHSSEPAHKRPTTRRRRLIRRWAKRAAVAAACVVAVGAAAPVASQVPDALIDLLDTPASLPAPPAPLALAVPNTMVPPVPPLEPAPSVAAGDYLVSVGLYSSRARAERLVEELMQVGLPAVQRPLQLRTQLLQQVALGPFVTRADALTALERLRQLGGHDDASIVSLDPPAAP